MAQSLNNKVINSTKWTTITEVMAKLVAPITSMVLARLLTPEAFGVVATISMVISFTEIFTNAGFGKYMVQHEFVDEVEQEQCANVAFWSNFSLSMLSWLIIIVFCEPIATLVGSPGYGLGVAIAGANIPIAAFSSIQSSLYSRKFDFKTLFFRRLIGIIVPLVVTVPLAFILRNYWALLIGTLTTHVSNAIFLTLRSDWRPRLYYKWSQFKMMISFSVWSIVESVTIWATSYADVFIIGTYLSAYYIGIYKTSMTTVNQFTTIITAATTPVLFSALCRLQNDFYGFENMLLKFQKIVGILVVPIGVGIFLFSDVVTVIMLGDQWAEATGFIGLWGLFGTITVLLSHYASTVYRSMGKPKLSALAQVLHMAFVIPALLIAVKYDFKVLYTTRSLLRLQSVLVDCLLMYFCIKLSIWKMIKNIMPSFVASGVMFVVGFALRMITHNIVWSFVFIAICIIVYFVVLARFQAERNYMLHIKDYVVSKYIKHEKKDLI